MALATAAKTLMLQALDTASVAAVLYDYLTTPCSDTVEINFSVSNGVMSLAMSIVFEVPAGKIPSTLYVYGGGPTLLFAGALPGTTAERTFAYAGTYTVTGCTVTLS